MGLPKPQLPIFELTVPSTKQKVKFRQFTVREEKALVQAQQLDDIVVITNAVRAIIESCCTGLKDTGTLTLFDVEYILTRIRAKSVGESIDLNMACDADPSHDRIPVRIMLEKIEVEFPEGHSKKIDLYDDVGVMMKYPDLDNVAEFDGLDGFDAIVMCIDYIYTSQEVYHAKDQTKEELVEFLNDLTKKQVNKIDELFFNKMPVYQHEISYTCRQCGHEHKKTIKGLSNFFV